MLQITSRVSVPHEEITFQAMRSQGAGGQNVNKVSTAVHLFFDVPVSSLPESYKEKLVQLRDHRITAAGVIVIKSQEYRSQEKNKEAALLRRKQLILSAVVVQKKRRATKPTRGSQKRRIESKKLRGKTKNLRRKPND